MSRFSFTRLYLEDCCVELKPIHESGFEIRYKIVGSDYYMIYNDVTGKGHLARNGRYMPVDLNSDIENLPENIQNLVIFNLDVFSIEPRKR
jgi:hypothetical protein